jgi:hypothetical protein
MKHWRVHFTREATGGIEPIVITRQLMKEGGGTYTFGDAPERGVAFCENWLRRVSIPMRCVRMVEELES